MSKVKVSDMNSQGQVAGRVPTSDGSGAVVWGDGGGSGASSKYRYWSLTELTSWGSNTISTELQFLDSNGDVLPYDITANSPPYEGGSLYQPSNANDNNFTTAFVTTANGTAFMMLDFGVPVEIATVRHRSDLTNGWQTQNIRNMRVSYSNNATDYSLLGVFSLPQGSTGVWVSTELPATPSKVTTKLSQLADVDAEGIANDQALVWDSASQSYKPKSVGGVSFPDIMMSISLRF